MRINFLLAICTILFFDIETKAQEIWSLEKCIAYAIENNIQVKQQQLLQETNEQNLVQSKASLAPNLNAGATHGYNWGQTIDRFTNQFATERVRTNNLFISSNVNVFNGFQSVNTIKQNKLNWLASQQDVEKIKNDISLNVANAYLQILFNNENAKIAEAQMNVTKLQVERVNILFDAGTVAKSNLLDLESQLATEELNLVMAQNTAQLSILSLTQLLQLPIEQTNTFKIVEPPINNLDATDIAVSAEEIYNIALLQQPQIKSAEYNAKSADKSLDIARGARSPSISLSGSLGSGYSGASLEGAGDLVNFGRIPLGVVDGSNQIVNSLEDQLGYSDFRTKPFTNQIDDNVNKSVSLSLNIPIFNGLFAKTSVARARINMENAVLNMQSAKNQLLQDVQSAHLNAQAAYKKYIAATKATDAAKESFGYAQIRYDQKIINSVDYINSKNISTNAEVELIKAKYEYVFRTKILDFYQSKPITLE
jgi:outer membrane protein